jgi:hypothetical protein
MRRMLATVCTVATVLLAGCGGDPGTPPTQVSLAGIWNLQSVNGEPLPYTVQPANPKIEILSDELVLSPSGNFSQSVQARATSSGTITTQNIQDGGTYIANGTVAEFTFNDGSTGSGTVDGNTLTVAQVGFSLMYRKQQSSSE